MGEVIKFAVGEGPGVNVAMGKVAVEAGAVVEVFITEVWYAPE